MDAIEYELQLMLINKQRDDMVHNLFIAYTNKECDTKEYVALLHSIHDTTKELRTLIHAKYVTGQAENSPS